MKKLLNYLALLVAFVYVSCQKERLSGQKSTEEIASSISKPVSNTFYGPQVQLGDGHLRSWIRLSPENVPEELGIEMTSGVLENLPPTLTESLIPLHHKAKELTPYDNIVFNTRANPPPVGFVTVPHFNTHFYMISEEEQMSMPAPSPANTSLSSSAAYGRPPAGVLPADYTIPGPTFGGRHWLDKNGSLVSTANNTLSHEFMYGTFDGKVIFLEPIVSMQFLLSGTEVHKAIKQPLIFDPINTYYPTQYNIYTDSKTGRIYVSLSEFVWK